MYIYDKNHKVSKRSSKGKAFYFWFEDVKSQVKIFIYEYNQQSITCHSLVGFYIRGHLLLFAYILCCYFLSLFICHFFSCLVFSIKITLYI